MTNCDACYGEKTEDCPDDCLTSHIRYVKENDARFPLLRVDDGKSVDDWFKRCMTDFPYLAVVEFHTWFNKWFSQFKEDSD
jgi:hypothetical protein